MRGCVSMQVCVSEGGRECELVQSVASQSKEFIRSPLAAALPTLHATARLFPNLTALSPGSPSPSAQGPAAAAAHRSARADPMHASSGNRAVRLRDVIGFTVRQVSVSTSSEVATPSCSEVSPAPRQSLAAKWRSRPLTQLVSTHSLGALEMRQGRRSMAFDGG
jgi:hypothetical protein